MERLTQKDEQGNWCLKGVTWEQLHVGQTITQKMGEKLYGALWKLMEYEGTCLTPEQIREMDQLYLDKCREVTELRKKLEWIPVTERLPKDNINPVTQDAYVYPVTISSGNVRDVRFYSFYNGHWYNFGPHPLDDIVVAWLPRPDPYRPED